MAGTSDHPETASSSAEPVRPAATPRWVKITWISVGVVVLLVLALVLSGHQHGPWQHMPGHHGLGPAVTAVDPGAAARQRSQR
jgi:hypothetical protein